MHKTDRFVKVRGTGLFHKVHMVECKCCMGECPLIPFLFSAWSTITECL